MITWRTCRLMVSSCLECENCSRTRTTATLCGAMERPRPKYARSPVNISSTCLPHVSTFEIERNRNDLEGFILSVELSTADDDKMCCVRVRRITCGCSVFLHSGVKLDRTYLKKWKVSVVDSITASFPIGGRKSVK
jgi:hypothetical protein